MKTPEILYNINSKVDWTGPTLRTWTYDQCPKPGGSNLFPCNHCNCIEDCKKRCMESEYCNAFVIHKIRGGDSECEFRSCDNTLISIPSSENGGEGYYITNGTFN